MKKKNTKQEILDALEGGKKILLCPSCKHNVFLRKSYSRVEITEEDDSLLDNLVEGFEEYEYACAKCNKDVDVGEMLKEKIPNEI